MRNLYPLIFSVILILFFGVLELLLLRLLNKRWWEKKYVRRAAWGLPLFGIVMVVLLGLGEWYNKDWLTFPAAILVVLTAILELALMLSLPFSGVLHFVHWITEKVASRRRERQPDYVDPNRRAVLRMAAVTLPAVAIATGTAGVARAIGGVNVYIKTIKIDSLPSDLDGLKILHLSDIHLRHYVSLDDLAIVLDEAAQFSPDITLVTGDIADDVSLLPDALDMIDRLGAPLGAYAVLGNHEYFRGISQVLATFKRSPIRLLVDEGVRITTRSAPLFIGGLDDPRQMHGKNFAFHQRSIDRIKATRKESDFVVLMSHRPDALNNAATANIPLTLAGHTHGGQVGFAERSMFESLWPDRYLWGHYRIEGSHLYTSSGVGHWFPFRLGCPAEAPVIELRRG